MLCNALCQYRLKNPLPYVHIPGQCFSPLATQQRIRGVGRAASLVLNDRSSLTQEANFKHGSYDRVLRKRRQHVQPCCSGNTLVFTASETDPGPDILDITLTETGYRAEIRKSSIGLNAVQRLRIDVSYLGLTFYFDATSSPKVFTSTFFFSPMTLYGRFSFQTVPSRASTLTLGSGSVLPCNYEGPGPFLLLLSDTPFCTELTLQIPVDALAPATCDAKLILYQTQPGYAVALYVAPAPLQNYPTTPLSTFLATVTC